MNFVASITELTTAGTDLLLALAALMAIGILRAKSPLTTRSCYWLGIFSCLVVAAFLGAVAHGVALPNSVKEYLWLAIYLALALLVALFVVAVVYDVFGALTARRVLLPMMIMALGFVLYVAKFSTSFLPFIMYEVAAMLFALSGYIYLGVRGFAGANWFSLGILLTIVAAGIQATKALSFTLVWPFDHNSVYHLLQIVALLLLLKAVLLSREAELD
ncbi:hypothetical protein QWY82_07535 [Simiduia curdlanivorans]|uniref:DUF6962 family protein n=1 Tax=Simiduia curdlanivorans TaxID=1492769 RepID=A0ABV8V730_9GAMM|nr:hypothetical protein [Simiduia curdlanivorans]MDN3638654.1 hypothetical protein [Simiduia curdlanivorans]